MFLASDMQKRRGYEPRYMFVYAADRTPFCGLGSIFPASGEKTPPKNYEFKEEILPR